MARLDNLREAIGRFICARLISAWAVIDPSFPPLMRPVLVPWLSVFAAAGRYRQSPLLAL